MAKPKKESGKKTKAEKLEEEKKKFEKIKKIAKSTPKTPGIYQMLNKEEEIMYIGKAKNLRNRILQYFQDSKAHSPKTKKMIEQIADLKYIETNSELEAIILETNLIKQHRPKYNILMRDDKNYVYIKVTTNEDFPKVEVVRRVMEDKARYFGPKTSTAKVEKTLNLLRKIFKYRTCNLRLTEINGEIQVKGSGTVPCMDYHIKRCNAPCIKGISKSDYRESIDSLIDFLSGNYQDTITRLTYKMMRLADDKKFEAAGNARDQIKAIKDVFLPQVISEPELISRDVIGLQQEFDQTYVNLFQFRKGKLIDQDNFQLNSPENDDKNRTESFIQFYYSEATDIPEEIFVREKLENKKALEEWLKEKSGHSVKIMNPLKGKKNKVLALSEKNAKSFARQSKVKWISDSEKTTGACRELSETLGLEKELNRIECYDISHIAGVETVGSMVVFEKGAPKADHYRRFNIKHLDSGKIDDYASMEEVLTRRLSKLSQKEDDEYKIRKPIKIDREFIYKKMKDEKLFRGDLDYNTFLTLKKDKKIVAFGRIKMTEELPEINSLWVDKKERGKKLGYLLIKALIEKNRLPKVYLICSKDFKDYYEKFGFKELKTVPEVFKKEQKKCEAHCGNPAYFVYHRTKSEADKSFSTAPDLIIVDGGKGQLSSAQKAISKAGANIFDISLCAIAKREEEIFIPDQITSIKLPRNSQALYLVQRVRDEAHRFAHAFSKSSHAKSVTKSQLDQIPGVGTIMKRKLLKTFGSINGIKDAPMKELTECCGEYLAKKLKENL
jgi:excinuclease ABC subunit C